MQKRKLEVGYKGGGWAGGEILGLEPPKWALSNQNNYNPIFPCFQLCLTSHLGA